MDHDVDIFIIGGGINGCGIARDASGRGHSVYLCEMNDLASGTSSGSTKLVHGGLRYLEHYEFRLVREALSERESLWAMAPHIIKPLRFVLPYHKGLRPAWLLRLGLFLYDHIGGRKLLPATKTVGLSRGHLGEPLADMFKTGFEYSDCWVDDARLVVLNAMHAREKGAIIETRTRCVDAKRESSGWSLTVRDINTGSEKKIRARSLVNAAGPWVDQVLGRTCGKNDVNNVRLVQGSHIVVPRLYDHDRCYIFQNADNRIIFAIPYQQDFTLIGTTDREYEGDPADVCITEGEISYLCDAASEYFKVPVLKENLVWDYSGVRPLFDDGASKAQEATRDYVLQLESENGTAPLLNIFGGKITTYRRLAESALSELEEALSTSGTRWTEKSTLPGGDFLPTEFDDVVVSTCQKFEFLDHNVVHRLVSLYGTLVPRVLDDARSVDDLGKHFGAGLYENEVRYLIDHEWACNAADILWRRTKLGLFLNEDDVRQLDTWMHDYIKSLTEIRKMA